MSGRTGGSGGNNGSSSNNHNPNRPARPRQPSGDVVKNAQKKMGYRNNWHRKQVPNVPPVAWPEPFADAPRVAIIGGGLSGLACAEQLARDGIRSCVFDTGVHGVGGRLATRSNADKSIHKKWSSNGQVAENMVRPEAED